MENLKESKQGVACGMTREGKCPQTLSKGARDLVHLQSPVDTGGTGGKDLKCYDISNVFK